MLLSSTDLRPVIASASLPSGEGWKQVGEMSLALVLSAAVGLEREIRQKSAGLRTYTLVGVGSALFMLISKYGFMDVITANKIVLDPSRVAAQIVSGVGFLGGGIIFVRRDAVRGLTTAAGIWLTAAIGAASGAGLLIIAVLSTAIYFIVALLFPLLSRRLPRSAWAISVVRVRYPDGRGLLRDLLELTTARGFGIDQVATERVAQHVADADGTAVPTVEVTLHVHGRASVNELAAGLSEVEGVHAVVADDANTVDG
jgi:putative Mg2+ transporter-C (MgtC) family protein